jgi:hypothetical protein
VINLKNKILVITEKKSDMLNILEANNVNITVFKPGEISGDALDEFDAVGIFGGTEKEPVLLCPKERNLVEAQLKKGKRVFTEYCASITDIYYENPSSTRYDRLAFTSEEVKINGIELGDILDDQCGMRIKPYPGFCSSITPILQYTNIHCHKRLDNLEGLKNEIGDRALWFDRDNLLVCSFRLADFIKGRYAPKARIKNIVKFILEWLCQREINVDGIEDSYELLEYNEKSSLETQLKFSVEKAMNWFEKAGILIEEGRKGVYEGLGTEIYPDGTQRFSSIIRTDCVGETSMAYFMNYLLTGNPKNLQISDNLSRVCFEEMQCKDEGPHYGMVRWTNQAWGVCYQDDVARAIIPQMLKCLYTGKSDYLKECADALKFLVKTTGSDGTRVFRTDNINLNKEKIKELSEKPGNLASAHYNAYYFAALLIGYKLTSIEEFKAAAVKGMTTIMNAYPDTVREQSETEEYCRLVLPLSWLYWITGEELHRTWLYRVVEDLQRFKHQSGAYLEWDEGYKASMRNTGGKGECSLLTSNGDAIVDMLYSNNWLPLGFMQAYLVTGDSYFKELWRENAKFMISSQIISKDESINGAWTRGFDVEFMEVFGSPADVGWGPWAIESGWTVAEIVSGLIAGLVEDKIRNFYK